MTTPAIEVLEGSLDSFRRGAVMLAEEITDLERRLDQMRKRRDEYLAADLSIRNAISTLEEQP